MSSFNGLRGQKPFICLYVLLSPSSQSLTLVEHKLVLIQMVLYEKGQAPAQLLAVAFPAAIMESIICMALFSFF